MYFSKKYWKLIIYIYKLNYLNLSILNELNKETKSFLPKIIDFIKFIKLYNGRYNKNYKIIITNFKLKKLL